MEAMVPDDVMARLNQLQQTLREKQLPVLIVFEGSSGRVIGRVSNELMRCLEPIGIRYDHFDPADISRSRSLLEFLQYTPGKGQIGLYDRSWYSSMIERSSDNRDNLDRMLDAGNNFEKYLVQNGMLLIKIFLRANEASLEKYGPQYGPGGPKKSFLSVDHVDPVKYREVMLDHVYAKTDTEYAGWTTIKVGELKDTVLETVDAVIRSIENRLESKPGFPSGRIEKIYPNPRGVKHRSVSERYGEEMDEASERVRALQMDLSLSDRSLIVCFEGWDAAGKGSCIKHLCHALNPRGYGVFRTGAPTEEALRHTYLWRFSFGVPEKGHITIFDRTWYGRMMVEPIEGFCTKEEYRRSPSEINGMERVMTYNKSIVLKFWLDIGSKEQLKRFKKREKDPLKQWKITDDDWRNRSKRDEYDSHVNTMMESTNTEYAPWIVIDSNKKKHARLAVLKIVAETLERELKK